MPDSVTGIAADAFEGSDNVTFICESKMRQQNMLLNAVLLIKSNEPKKGGDYPRLFF